MAAMFDGQSQIAHLEAGNILGSSQYQRANPSLSQTINLDDCGAISDLEGVQGKRVGEYKTMGLQ
jgi:hypothetical protein